MLSAPLWASAAVVVTGGGSLSYTDTVPGAGEVRIEFAPCMANELFTFSRVSLNGKLVNATSSDNIGPFGLAGGGWSGGNHLNGDMRSARTESVAVYAQPGNRPLSLTKADTLTCTSLDIYVNNRLLMPADTAAFADECMRYTVAGNSVEVNALHVFLNAAPVTVNRYYGMQSMFIGETEVLTPGGLYSEWTPISQVDRFNRASSPRFCTFVEHSPDAYQACWLDPAAGTLGDRSMVSPDDWVFIGNSYSKAYHKTVGDRAVRRGQTTRWHGVYSWFAQPLTDDSDTFAYRAYIGATPTVISLPKAD